MLSVVVPTLALLTQAMPLATDTTTGSAANAVDDAACKIAVLSLEGVGLSESQQNALRLLSEGLAAELTAQSTCSVITESDVRSMVNFEAIKATCGVDTSNCMVELSNALGVQYVVSGSLGVLGSNLLLNARILDVRSSKVVGRADTKDTADENAVRNQLPNIAYKLIDDAKLPKEDTINLPLDPNALNPIQWAGVGLLSTGLAVGTVFGILAAGNELTAGNESNDIRTREGAVENGRIQLLVTGGGVLVALIGSTLLLVE